ncbi:MAG: YidC/Oxa1 family membrane protein insertase [Clostridiales bacterium]|jgi:YidC/Oxa1 family membrane protein insertase|nr:YidC/Oxa1 family membrane protein insertase [Clostridiales bacterium]
MAVLNTVLLAAADGLGINQPGGPWAWFILTVFGFVADYGWRVVVFTVLLKLALSPLDIFQRVKTRKNQKITKRLEPEIEKLKKQYPDQTQFAQKQMALNKREGYSYLSACLPALLTMVIFITLLISLNSISQYMNFKQYYELHNVYTAEHAVVREAETAAGKTDKEANDLAVAAGQEAVKAHYAGIKEDFLWIKNIWSPDVFWQKPINDFDKWKANAGKYATDPAKSGMFGGDIDEAQKKLNQMTADYDIVMSGLIDDESNATNGFLILPILSLGLSVLQQFLSQRQQKQMGQSQPGGAMGGNTMKMMMWIMPIMIGIFSLQYTAAFAIYLVINYAITLTITLTANLIFYLKDKNDKFKLENEVQKYGRPDPKDL